MTTIATTFQLHTQDSACILFTTRCGEGYVGETVTIARAFRMNLEAATPVVASELTYDDLRAYYRQMREDYTASERKTFWSLMREMSPAAIARRSDDELAQIEAATR